MTGAQKIENATYIPPGLWDINPNSVPNDYRYVVADTNNNNGVQDASISVNSSGRWGIAIGKRNANGDWEGSESDFFLYRNLWNRICGWCSSQSDSHF